MLKGKDKLQTVENIHNFSMITTYSRQHYDIRKILTKHWGVLKNDNILSPV